MKLSLLWLYHWLRQTAAFAPVSCRTTTTTTSRLQAEVMDRPVTSTAIPPLDQEERLPMTYAPRGRGSAMQSMQSQSRQETTPSSWSDAREAVIVHGGSLRTWSYATTKVDRVQVVLQTKGRPLNANVDLWQGPDNTPQKMGVYIEDGAVRPFICSIETPRGQNTVAVRNTGQMEFPLMAHVQAAPKGSPSPAHELAASSLPETIQGGAIKTYSFAPSVSSVQVLLQTDGRPLNARIELLQGPNNNKQVMELYTEDGLERPFFTIIETPGVGNVVRVFNTAPIEFPMAARVEPYMVEVNGRGSAIAYGFDGL